MKLGYRQVCIHWDTGEDNVYRYGADYCYDVVEQR